MAHLLNNGDNGKKGITFERLLSVAQILAIVVGGVWALAEIKGEIRAISDKVGGIDDTVDRIVEYLGIWRPKGGSAYDLGEHP